MNDVFDYVMQLVRAIPVRLRSIIFAGTFIALGWLMYHDFRPTAVMATVNAAIVTLDQRVSVIEDNTAILGDMQRWMCFQNERDAVKAGIPCMQLIGVIRP